MKFAHLASRVAVGGVSAALATAGLVGVTATTASATPVLSNYNCTNPLAPAFSAAVTVDVALLPPTAPAGFPVPAGFLGFDSTFTLDNATASALSTNFGVTGGKSDDFGTSFGTNVVKAPVVWGTSTTGPTTTTFSGRGSNAALTLPKAGTYSVTMPATFTLQGTNASGQPVAGITASCTTAAPAQIGTITLEKQNATVKAKAPKSAKKGAVVSVKGKVSNDQSKAGGVLPSGKVTVKDGKKKVGTAKIKNGKFVVKLKGLKVGVHTLTVSYAGDDFDNKSVSKALKVTVKA
jgi:hypothetical protein